MIPITKPSLDISDLKYIKKVIKSKILTDGYYQKKTEELIKKLINSKFVSLTQSCTAGLEIASILINLKKGDEVIMPSYGFVSVANSVVLRNAKPVFTEIDPKTLNISYDDIKRRITRKTKRSKPIIVITGTAPQPGSTFPCPEFPIAFKRDPNAVF